MMMSTHTTVSMAADYMPEALFQQRITDLCDLLGLLWHHETDSRRSKRGLPDLIICGPGGVGFFEVKTQKGKVTAEQHAWIEALTPHVYTGVWRPADWPRIEQFLRRLAQAA